MGGQTEFERKKQRHASGESTISTDSVSHYIPIPPDGGYGWVIVFASFMNHVIVDGIAFTVGIFYTEFCEYFQEGDAKTALAGSLLAGCYLFSAPVASSLVNKFGCQPVTIAGSITATVGFILSRFSPNVDFLILTYGVIGGTGLGLLYLPNVIAVSYYFQERRAMATGIAVCGAGVGCFIFAPFGRFLMDTLDWKNAMLIVAGITLNGCVFGSLLRPLQPLMRSKRPRAKNILDRLKEQTAHRMGRHRKESECSISSMGKDREVFKRIQQIKWAKETALHEEDSISDLGSVLNSVRRLDQTDTPTSERPFPFSTSHSSYGGQEGGISFTTPTIVENVVLDTSGYPPPDKEGLKAESEGNSQMMHNQEIPVNCDQITVTPPVDNVMSERSSLLSPLGPLSEVAEEDTKAPQSSVLDSTISVSKDSYNRHDVQLSRNNPNRVSPQRGPKYPDTLCVENSLRLRLPQGIHKADYARPLYRSDIFYSGSIVQIPEYRSQPDVQNYVKSVTMIPDEIPAEDECCLWRHLPMSKAAKDTLKQMTDLSLLRDPLLIVPALSNLVAFVGLYVPFIYMTSRAIELGVPDFEAAFLLSVVGITNTVGRIIAGCIADLKWMNSLLLHNVALLIGGIACISNMFCVTYPLMCVFAAVFGLCVATWISLTSIVLCDLLGLEKLTNAFGLLCMARGIAAMIGSPVAGIVKDATQNFDAPFHVSGAMLLLGGCLCCLLHLPYFQNNMNSNINDADGNSLAAYDANFTAENTKMNGVMTENGCSDDGQPDIV